MMYGVSALTRAGVVRAAMIAGLALPLAACSQSSGLLLGEPEVPAVSESRVAEMPQAEAQKSAEHWAKEHAQQPRSGKAALSYARSLKALGQKSAALAALQSSYLYNAQDREYLSEFGRLALEQGHAPLAQQLLERADDPAKPDWRILSARGVALAQQGQYKAAIPFLERARALAPEQASVANNLALAYTMDGNADRAEPMLRQVTSAGADPRVRQNLALVLRLQGKSDEAARVAMGNDLPMPPAVKPVSVAANPAPPPVNVAAVAPVRAVAREALPPVKTVAAIAPAPPRAPSRETPPIAAADPEDVIRAAIQAEIAMEQQKSRAIATSSVPQR